MRRRSGGRIVLGLFLVLLGGWFLASQFYPDLGTLINLEFSWPLILVGVGIFLLLFGLLIGAPGMAVPATIVGGIGGLMYWQNATGNWESWSYAWALIPGFVGLGVILAGLLEGRLSESLSGGGFLIVLSLLLFAVFSSMMGGPNLLGPYWPVLLILFGLWVLFRTLLRPREL